MAKTQNYIGAAVLGFAAVSLGLTSALALDTNPESRTKAGTHQFYVQCVGGVPNYTLKEEGTNAKDALKKAKAKVVQEHGSACYPNWEGLAS